jgi:hypothetical protein
MAWPADRDVDAVHPPEPDPHAAAGSGPGCDDRSMSRRDLVHVLGALWDLSSGDSAVGVPVAAIDQAIGRGHGDMRTPLNLQSLSDEGLVALQVDGRWGLTPQGVAWIRQDRDLSGG